MDCSSKVDWRSRTTKLVCQRTEPEADDHQVEAPLQAQTDHSFSVSITLQPVLRNPPELHFVCSQATTKELAEQVSQDYIAVVLVQCVAEHLTCLSRIGSQLCQTAKRLDWLVIVTTLPPPIYQINNVDIYCSYNLQSVSVRIFVLSEESHTASHCSHVCGGGSIPMALHRACHAAISSSAPYHFCNSACNAFWYLFQASTDRPSSRRQPSCFRSLA